MASRRAYTSSPYADEHENDAENASGLPDVHEFPCGVPSAQAATEPFDRAAHGCGDSCSSSWRRDSSSGRGRSCDSREGYYRPSGQGDIFLFSPSLCSRTSNDSTSSSFSFDGLSYSYSPAYLTTAVAKPFSPPSLPLPERSHSPLFVEAYLAGAEAKPISRLEPSTPFQELFNSSPAGYWQSADPSVSPISRHSSVPTAPDNDMDEGSEDDSDDEPLSGKLKSLLDYKSSRDSDTEIPDSPRRPSSPSSLSSLSSTPSSPSALFSSALVASSSQTSQGRPSCSPAHRASICSPLGSPLKLHVKTSARPAPASHFVRRSVRSQAPSRTTRNALATEILNQLGQSRVRRDPAAPSPLILSSSPMPVLSDSDDENYEPLPNLRRPKKRAPLPASPAARKKRRTTTNTPAASTSTVRSRATPASGVSPERQTSPAGEDEATESPVYPQRILPPRIPIHEDYPLFYRRFPVSSVIGPELAAYKIKVPKVPDAIPNPPRDDFDLYTPRFVKGKGTTKVGLCPICHESVARGGEGKKLWLSMKFSAFKYYHMQYAHGISATSGRPFSPPTGFRTIVRANPGRHEKTELMEGRCHKCTKWVPIQGIKDVPTKVPEIFWWKHAAACHQGSTITGEGGLFVEDEVFSIVSGAAARAASGEGEGEELGADEDMDAAADEDRESEEDSDADAEGEVESEYL